MSGPLPAAGSVVLAAGSAQARLGLRVLLGVGLLLVLVAVIGALARIWRSRAERDEENLPDLPEPPVEPGTVLAAPLRGTYLGTVDAGHWLEWISARGLGGGTGGYLSVYETGVRVDRGDAAFWIPREAVRGARLERAHAGKVSAPGRLIVVAWSFDGHELETGFRGEDRARQPKTVRAVHELIGPPPAHLAAGDVTSPHALPRVRPRLRPRAIVPGHGGAQRPGSGQPTEEIPAIRAGLRRRRAPVRGDARPVDPRAVPARSERERDYQPMRRPRPGYPDPARASAPPPPTRPTGEWQVDPRTMGTWRATGTAAGSASLPVSEPTDSGQYPIVDPLTSPLGEVRRLKEDR